MAGFATAVALTTGLSALGAAPAAADDEPAVAVGTRLAARTHPAVQLTSLTYSGEVVVPTSTINQAAFNRLVEQATQAVLNGKISSDERSIAKWMFQRIAADVNVYLSPTTPERTVDAEVGGLCTGWWVTPDGYMVTGAHCVEVGETELARLFAQQALAKFNKQDAQEIIKGLRGIEADEEIVKLAQQIYVTFNTTHMRIRGLQKSISVLQSLPGGGVDKTAKAVPAELVSVGESYPGKDFAAQGERPAEPADRPPRRRLRRADRRHALHQRIPRPRHQHPVLQPGVPAGAGAHRGAVQRQAHHAERRAVHPDAGALLPRQLRRAGVQPRGQGDRHADRGHGERDRRGLGERELRAPGEHHQGEAEREERQARAGAHHHPVQRGARRLLQALVRVGAAEVPRGAGAVPEPPVRRQIHQRVPAGDLGGQGRDAAADLDLAADRRRGDPRDHHRGGGGQGAPRPPAPRRGGGGSSRAWPGQGGLPGVPPPPWQLPGGSQAAYPAVPYQPGPAASPDQAQAASDRTQAVRYGHFAPPPNPSTPQGQAGPYGPYGAPGPYGTAGPGGQGLPGHGGSQGGQDRP